MFELEDGVQIKFLHLGQYGCFVLSLCWIADDWLKKRGYEKNVLTMVEEMVRTGACVYSSSYRYYMRDPAKALEAVTGVKWTQRVVPIGGEVNNYEVLYYEKLVGQTHFVVGQDEKVIFDPSNVLKAGGWKLKHKREFREVI